MSAPRFDFYPRGFENTPHPCLVVEDPQGGDPRILALLSVIHRPTDLQGLVEMANAYLDSIDPPPTCPICKGGVCEAPSECGGIERLSIPQQFEPVSKADEFAPRPVEAHIDRECQLLGHEFAYEPHEDPGEGPMHCIHCGAANA